MKKTRTKKAKKDFEESTQNHLLGVLKRLERLEQEVKIQKDRNMGIIHLVPEDFKEEAPVKIGRWKPEPREPFCFLNEWGYVEETVNRTQSETDSLWEQGNCYKSRFEAEKAKERMILKQEYVDFCTELNGIRHVNWENDEYKYFLYWNYESSCICIGHDTNGRSEGTTYCLDEELKYKALDKFGEEKLKVILGVD